MNKKRITFSIIGLIVVLLGIIATLFITAGPSTDTLRSLAKAGTINVQAPVQDTQSIVINAPQDKVWVALSTINEWPTWQTDIKSAQLTGDLRPGSQFTWDNAGSPISSELVVVEPNGQLAWFGTTFGAKAVHVWELKAVPGQPEKTEVLVRESLDGFMIQYLYGNDQLHGSLERWLGALKGRTETL